MSAGGHRNSVDQGRIASGLKLSRRRLEGGDGAQHEVRARVLGAETGFKGLGGGRDIVTT